MSECHNVSVEAALLWFSAHRGGTAAEGVRQRAHSGLFIETHTLFISLWYFYFSAVWDPSLPALSHEKIVPLLMSWDFKRGGRGEKEEKGSLIPSAQLWVPNRKTGIQSFAHFELWFLCFGWGFLKTVMLWDCTENQFAAQCHLESELVSGQFSTRACPTSQTAFFCCFWDELDFHRRELSPLFSKSFSAKPSNSQAQSSEGTEACWIQKSNLFPQAVYVLY